MGKAFDAAWYDEAMTSENARALEPLEHSPWLQLYQDAAALVPKNAEVIDLGCGTGRFIEQLYRFGHYGKVTGVDFSPACLEAAREYTRRRACQYELCDLTQWQPPTPRAGNTVFTCLEVLEHLEDDLDLVRRIPPRHTLLFSVPNFESASHVRWFRGAGDVWARYDRWLIFRRWSLLRHGDKATHLLQTWRRDDAW